MEKTDGSKELIAFYNVENLFPPDLPAVHKLDPTKSGLRNWDERKYNNKLFKLAQAFQLIEETENVLPMLIGLAEIRGDKPLQELVQMAPFHSNYGVIHYNSLDERGVDVALLYDKRKIEMISSEPITYFFEVATEHYDYYDTTRDVLYCKVKFEEETLNIFVLHLPSKREKDVNKPKRDYILKELHERILKIKTEKNEEIIICGDFNENPDENSIKNLLLDDQLDVMLTNPYEKLFQNSMFSTYHFKSGLLFDQIIATSTLFQLDSSLKVIEAKVFNHERLSVWSKKLLGRPFRTFSGTRYLGGYSDHFPIYIILSK